MATTPTLFVNIASYRDPELIPTLRDMIAMARDPQNLRIAICWQHDHQSRTLFTEAGMTQIDRDAEASVWHFRWQKAQITVIPIHYFLSRGACWARFVAEQYYAGEDFLLQIDSHCRFTLHWDQRMIEMLSALRSQSSKPVLSTYPPAYDPQETEEKRSQFVSRLIFREFSREGLPMLSSTPLKSDSPVRGSYIAGGFIFADGSFVQDVSNDPDIFFAGEEIAMAARAFTHGYDIYTPHQLLLWHFYGRRKENKVWADHSREAKNSGEIEMAWWERDALSKKRIRTLFGLEAEPVDLGPYCLGDARSLYQFERLIGIDFKQRAVLPEVIGADKRSVFLPHEWPDDLQWAQRVISPFVKSLKLSKADMDDALETAHWWYLGVYSANNRLVDEKKLTPEEMSAALKADDPDKFALALNFTLPPSETPAVVRLCPFNDLSGWGAVVEQPW